MKSSLKNMVLVLFCITLIASACVGLVNMITVDPIAKAKEAAVKEALSQVLPEFDATEKSEHTVDDLLIIAHKATKEGVVVGYAIEGASPNGFNGNVSLMVGYTAEGVIYNVEVLAQAETPGLGANMESEDNVLIGSFKGKKAEEMTMTVRKDGGDVDALTAATISSRAYAEAVALTYEVFKGVYEEANAVMVNPAEVLPEHDEVFASEIEGVVVYTATKEGHAVGYAIEGTSEKGFNGTIRLLVGFEPNGTIYDIDVLEQNETPGLGSRMCEEDNVLLKSLKGKRAHRVKFALRSEGGSVDAISHATISSRAYIEAVESAYKTFKKIEL